MIMDSPVKRIVAEVPENLKLRVEKLLDKKGMTWVGLIKLLLTRWVEEQEGKNQ